MNVLIFAPHRDDELIGVGGTLLKRKAAGDDVTVCVVTAQEGMERTPYTTRVHNEMLEAHKYCGVNRYIGFPFTANQLETVQRKVLNKAFEDALKAVLPEEVYVPFWGDMQKDHQIVVDAAMVAMRAKNAFAPKRIYAYETLSETGMGTPTENNAFIPNVYVDITDYLEGKLHALSFYQSQFKEFPDMRSLEAVEALAKVRGALANVKAAEAFMLVREIK